MKSRPSPAFLFYSRDFFSDPLVMVMPKGEQRDLLFLLSVQWDAGSIPADMGTLARITGSTSKEWAVSWERISQCFEPGEDLGTLQNSRMKAMREDYVRYRERCSEGGKRGRRIQMERQQKLGAESGANAGANTGANRAIPSPSSSPSSSPSKKGSLSGTYQQSEPVDGQESSKVPHCPHRDIIKIYHETLPELPQVRVWNGTSRKNLQARWREEKKRQSLDWWRTFFLENIKPSDFLMGRKTDFRANLGWIVGPRNFAKILNGQYQSHGPRTGSARTDANILAGQDWMAEGGASAEAG